MSDPTFTPGPTSNTVAALADRLARAEAMAALEKGRTSWCNEQRIAMDKARRN
jgi:hypothetical protein